MFIEQQKKKISNTLFLKSISLLNLFCVKRKKLQAEIMYTKVVKPTKLLKNKIGSEKIYWS